MALCVNFYHEWHLSSKIKPYQKYNILQLDFPKIDFFFVFDSKG
jgi:hypothetical protein